MVQFIRFKQQHPPVTYKRKCKGGNLHSACCPPPAARDNRVTTKMADAFVNASAACCVFQFDVLMYMPAEEMRHYVCADGAER